MILEQLTKTYPSDIKIAKLQKAIDAQDQIRLIDKWIEISINDRRLYYSKLYREKNESKISKLKKRKALLEQGYKLIIQEL